jgi:ATP-dependent Clp protease protease subunit
LDAVDSDKPIHFYINSPGGSVSDGLAIYDTMQWVRSEVWTVAMGMAASMGSLLVAAGKRRMSLPHTKFILHQPIGGVRVQNPFNNPDILLLIGTRNGHQNCC